MKQKTIQREQDAASATFRFMLIVIILAALVFVATAQAVENNLALETTPVVQQLDAAQKFTYLVVLAAVDYQQTVSTVVAHPDKYIEMNPILGPHPSRRDLLLFGITGMTALVAVQKFMPKPLAEIVVNSIIMTEQVNIWENEHAAGRRASTMPIMLVLSYQF